ncbi:MAG: PQQ-like beta-propeller repeat protein [Treponema sp.]|jgi:outer membrane protein assembly factor BamB|nr:PQQ-like beta-propeller repeat protein [Treponema sp.]
MNSKFLVCVLISTFVLASCVIEITTRPNPGPRPKPNPALPIEKEYHATALWQTEIFGNLTARPLIDGQYGYFSTSWIPGGGSRILKINLENGKVAWESPRILRYYFLCEPLKIGEYVYFPDDSGLILAFNDSNGDLAAIVRPGENENEALNYAAQENGPAVVWGNYLFWANRQGGLSRFDCGTIDFSKDPDEIQAIPADLVWQGDQQQEEITTMLSEDGKIYFLTGIDWYNDDPEYASTLAALDAETGELMWEKNLPSFKRQGFNALVLNGEKLHVIEEHTFCCNKNTGETIYINYNITDALFTYRWHDIQLHNNIFYYLADSYQEAKHGIVAVNADTGKKEFWISDVSGTSSPQLYGEKLYVLYYTGLRVYPIGNNSIDFVDVDGSFHGSSWSYTAVYNDKFIFFDYPDCLLTAIQCE